MTRPTVIPLPDDDYLLKLGQLMYSVSYVEGTVLFDLPVLASVLPQGPTVAMLAGMTTDGIGRKLLADAPHATDPRVEHYLRTAGTALVDLAPDRNSALHARSATDDQQRPVLNRWRGSEAFLITRDWLDEKIDLIDQKERDVSAAREALRPDLLA